MLGTLVPSSSQTLEDGEQIYVEIDENGYGIQEVRLYTPEGYF